MITEIKISNFKAIGDEVVIPIRPITLIFGANSSGKSSIIQCLMLLAQSINKDLTPNGKYVDLGSFQNLIHKNETVRKFEVEFTIDFDKNIFINIVDRHPKYEDHNWPERINKATLSLENSLKNYKSARVRFIFGYDRDNYPDLLEIDLFLGPHKHAVLTYNVEDRECIYQSSHPYWTDYFHCFEKIIDEMIIPFEAEEIEDNILSTETKHFDQIEKLLQILILIESQKCSTSKAIFFEKVLEWKHTLPKTQKSFKLLFNYFLELLDKKEVFNVSDYGFGEMLDYLQENIFSNTGFATGFPPTLTRSGNSMFDLMIKKDGDNFEKTLAEPNELLLLFCDPIFVFLKSLIYHGPIRDLPLRNYDININPHATTTLDAFNSNPYMFLRNNEKLVNQINNELMLLNTNYQLTITDFINERTKEKELFSVEFVDRKTKFVSNIKDTGFGFCQILPFIVSSRFFEDTFLEKKIIGNSIISIEQPELHLHPAMQSNLGDFFIRCAKRKTSPVTFILETHSEHIILRLLRRIRHTTGNILPKGVPAIFPDDISVLYVESNATGAKVTRILIDSGGDFESDWPQGFFEERAEELFN